MADDFSADRVTEVTTQGWGQRIGGSLVGALIGLLLVPGSIGLLYWNEGRAVAAAQALDSGAGQMVEANAVAIEPGDEGKLVHVAGPIETKTPARDPVFGVSGEGLLRLSRKVEMYQWKEEQSSSSQESVGGSKTTETTYSYHHVWSDQPISSSGLHLESGHHNLPMPLKSETFESGAATLGAFHVEPAVLAEISAFTAFQPDTAAPPPRYQAEAGGFYRGANPDQPLTGDLRVSFEAVPAQTVSIVAQQVSGTLTPFHGANGYTIVLAKPGMVSGAELFREKKQEEGTLTWILRGVGFVVMVIAFALLTQPLSMMFAFLPFLEGLVGAGAFLVALTLAVPVTLLTIAIAWIAHRPLVGGLLIAAAVGSVFLFHRFHRPRGAAAAAR